jgi:hypothetical protein
MKNEDKRGTVIPAEEETKMIYSNILIRGLG